MVWVIGLAELNELDGLSTHAADALGRLEVIPVSISVDELTHVRVNTFDELSLHFFLKVGDELFGGDVLVFHEIKIAQDWR